jgi:hypothetical protein
MIESTNDINGCGFFWYLTAPGVHFYIGLTDEAQLNVWEWVESRTALNYTNWGPLSAIGPYFSQRAGRIEGW